MGKQQIAKGWRKAGISELVLIAQTVQGKTTLSTEDPFENIEEIVN